MANSQIPNGYSDPNVPLPPSEVVNFRIGGKDIPVPVLNLDIVDRYKNKIRGIGSEGLLIEFCATAIEIIAGALEETRPDLDIRTLRKMCSWPEMEKIPETWEKLLIASGLREPPPKEPAPGEAESQGSESAADVSQPENPGTGTLTKSSPNSDLETFAPETHAG